MSDWYIPLRRSLALVDTCLTSAPGTRAFGAAEDPLRLNLPPLVNEREGTAPSPATLRVMAALYLQAELEQAGIIPTAEMLAQVRSRLAFASRKAAQKLEDFARHSRDWYDQENRDLIFARLFGLGRAAANAGGAVVNRDFQQRFVSLCLTIVRYSEDYRWGQVPGPAREAALRQVAIHLLINLGSRQFGNTVFAGRIIQEQLRHALELLNDPDIGAIFQARGLWNILRKVLGTKTPDVGRFVDRGQSGLRILNWLASIVSQLNATPPYNPILAPDSPVFVWAATWLRASGIEV